MELNRLWAALALTGLLVTAGNTRDGRAEGDFHLQVLPGRTLVEAGKSIEFEYWLYFNEPGTYQRFERDFSVEGHVVNLLVPRTPGGRHRIEPGDLRLGYSVYFDEKSQKVVAFDSISHSPAWGRILGGDVIEAVHGRVITDMKSMPESLKELRPNEAIQIVISREGVRQDLAIAPAPFGDESHSFNDEKPVRLGIFTEWDALQGRIVVRSGPDLRPGDILESVDGVRLESWIDWQRIAGNPQENKVYRIGFSRDGKPREISVTAGRVNAAVTAEYIDPDKEKDVPRMDTVLRGKPYIKARPLIVRARFDQKGTYRVDPGALRVVPDADKGVRGRRPAILQADPMEITVV